MKVYNNFQSNSKSVRNILDDNDPFVIVGCEFNIKQNSKYSLYYIGGKIATPVKLENCIFTGKLQNGAHYIDGELISKNSPKLIVKSCKFDHNNNNAMNLEDNNNFISKSLLNYIIDIDNVKDRKLTQNNSKFIAIASSSIFSLFVILLTIIVSIGKKKNSFYSDDQDETEMASDSLMPSQVSL